MKICTLCPRMCAVDRKSGERGICGQTTEIKVACGPALLGRTLHFRGDGFRCGLFFRLCTALCVLPE